MPAANEVPDGSAIAAAIDQQLGRLLASPPAAGLHLVATPIGNLSDITLRALATLAIADIVCCEDTRQSQKLLDRYAIRRSLRPYHEHNAEAERPRILEALAAGKCVALISDAGTPLVSDPGYKLVREAVAAGHAVTALPGPSAVLAALSTSALPTDRFHFGGFLPARQGQRRKRIEELAGIDATLILFEAPQRLGAALDDLFSRLGDRPAAIARELTKLHEETIRGRLGELALRYKQAEPKGECVVVVGAGVAEPVSDDQINALLEKALATMQSKDAVAAVARQLEVPKKRVYALAIARRSGNRESEA
jgi:16S rRNA (cytidine1402-2'-O)-methyltransferase